MQQWSHQLRDCNLYVTGWQYRCCSSFSLELSENLAATTLLRPPVCAMFVLICLHCNWCLAVGSFCRNTETEHCLLWVFSFGSPLRNGPNCQTLGRAIRCSGTCFLRHSCLRLCNAHSRSMKSQGSEDWVGCDSDSILISESGLCLWPEKQSIAYSCTSAARQILVCHFCSKCSEP